MALIECPECSKSDVGRLIVRIGQGWIKGNGFLDVEGRRRDMHLYKLQNDDPYAHMRPPGDKEVIEQKGLFCFLLCVLQPFSLLSCA